MAKGQIGLKSRLKVGKKNTALASEKKIEKLVKTLGGEEDKIIKTSIHYPESLYRKMKMKVARDGTTIRDYVLRLIETDLLSDDL